MPQISRTRQQRNAVKVKSFTKLENINLYDTLIQLDYVSRAGGIFLLRKQLDSKLIINLFSSWCILNKINDAYSQVK